MKTGYCLLLFLLFTGGTMEAQQWVRVWSDEFNYEGAPDSDKWSRETGCGLRNNEAQNYTSELSNSRVEDGNLILEARNESSGDCDYSSASINSAGKGDWLYGRVEVKAKLPEGKGLWPAIWMLPTDNYYGGWPSSGEIDIMEYVGFDPDKIHFNIHTEAFNHNIGTNKGASTTIQDVSSSFHEYAIEWLPESISFYVDDVRYFTFEKKPEYGNEEWPFNKPFHLIMNIAVGGEWGGMEGIDDEVFPQQMLVDYVRVYEWQPSSGPFSITTSSKGNGIINVSPEEASYDPGTEVELTAIPQDGFRFYKWEGDYRSSDNPFSLNINKNVNLQAVFLPECEQVVNGDFSEGIAGWNLNGSNGGVVSGRPGGDDLLIEISDRGTNPWDVQLSQNNVSLEAGETYILKFSASASAGRNIVAGVGMSSDPWSTYLYETTAIGPGMEEYIYEFTMPSDDPEARVLFDLGGSEVDVTLSEVSLCNQELLSTGKVYKENDAEVYFSEGYIYTKNVPVGKRMVVLNLSGKIVREYVTEEHASYPANFDAGMYIIRIGSSSSYTKKFVVP